MSSELSTEPPHIFHLTNESSVPSENDTVSDSTPRTYHKRSFSCSDISAFRNSDWVLVESERISVSRSMPSICTDNNFQYISKPSNSFSTCDFAFATVHTTEKTENNLNSSTIVTDTSASTNHTPIKNDEDSNTNNMYESLSNYNTQLFSTNSSSITPTSEINRSLINLTKNVRRNMRTAKNEFDNFFKQNSENTESGTPFSPESKIPLESIADEKKNGHSVRQNRFS